MLVSVGVKTEQGVAVAVVQQRTFNDCRLRQHQRDGCVGIITGVALRFIQLAPGGTAGIEQRLPTQLRDETAQLLFGQAVGAVVVKMIGYALIFQPAAGFLMVSQFLMPYIVSVVCCGLFAMA